jgi:hypothetical protein
MGRSDRVADKGKGITRVEEKRNTTTGRSIPVRLTGLDEDAMNLLVEAVQAATPNKAINRSKIIRAVGYLNDDQAFIKKIINSINKNT